MNTLRGQNAKFVNITTRGKCMYVWFKVPTIYHVALPRQTTWQIQLHVLQNCQQYSAQHYHDTTWQITVTRTLEVSTIQRVALPRQTTWQITVTRTLEVSTIYYVALPRQTTWKIQLRVLQECQQYSAQHYHERPRGKYNFTYFRSVNNTARSITTTDHVANYSYTYFRSVNNISRSITTTDHVEITVTRNLGVSTIQRIALPRETTWQIQFHVLQECQQYSAQHYHDRPRGKYSYTFYKMPTVQHVSLP